MNTWKKIKPEQLTGNPVQRIGSDWMLVTARKGDRVNSMTASWGGIGVMWNKPAVYLVIRPQRYTLECLDAGTTFSLTFFSREKPYREALNYLGTVSGRDTDKMSRCGLTVIEQDNTPCFAEGRQTLICRKLFRQPMDPAGLLDPSLEKFYADKDYHILFIAEILAAYEEDPA